MQHALENERPGLTVPLVWLAVGIFGTLAGAVAIGAAAYTSESGGMTATMIAAFPLGFRSAAAASPESRSSP